MGRVAGYRETDSADPRPRPERQPIVPRAQRRLPQRERLIQSMIELAAERGYREATIAGVSARAGVSSATFYEQFANKEECLVAAYRESAGRVLGSMSRAGEDARHAGLTPEILRRAIEDLMAGIRRDPLAARVLFVEGLAGASRLRDESLRVLGLVEANTHEAFKSIASEEGPIDLPITAVVGAIRNMVSRRLRVHAEDRLPRLVTPLTEWILSYRLPPGSERWSSGDRSTRERRLAVTDRGEREVHARERLPRGRHGLSQSEVIRSQRTRIIAATAEVTMEKGYGATTVADIVAAAGVAKDAFYEHFQDKEHAFLEAQEHPTQHILDRCAEAYFQVPDWPRRFHSHLEMLIGMIVENPAISHLRLVECYAAGPAAVRRAEEITRAFNIFLEEGYSYAADGRERSHVFSEAITGAIFELIRVHTARREPVRLHSLMPQLTYLGLTPFVGAVEATGLIEEIESKRTPATVGL